jgi:hypothetical protein
LFTSLLDMAHRIDSPDLDVTAGDFLVLQNAGQKSDSRMPGYLPIPSKLVTDGLPALPTIGLAVDTKASINALRRRAR